MKVDVLTLGPVGTNCYVVSKGGAAIVIDPADRADRIIDHLERNGLKLKGVLITHGHFDHVGAVDGLCKALGACCYVHSEDERMLRDARLNASMYFGMDMVVEADCHTVYGSYSRLTLDCFDVGVIHTPGHSKGSVCYLIGDSLFCGDLLFYSSCGRTDLYGGSMTELLLSVKKVVEGMDDGVTVYPGHDVCFTVKQAKECNYIIRDHILN